MKVLEFRQSKRKRVDVQSEKIYNKYRDMGLENVKRFSWKKCAQEYYEFYRELLETKRL